MSSVDHIAIAVPDLKQALLFWRDQLGLRLDGVEDVPTEGVKVAILHAGATRIELLEPLGPDTPVARSLAKRGPGIHHLALRVEDLAATMRVLREAGRPALHEEPQPGAGGARITFLHPRQTGGVLVELTTGHERGGETEGAP